MSEQTQTTAVKELQIDDYKFTVDTDLLDDVEAFEHIDRIENKGQIAAIVPLLNFLVGEDEYKKMKAYFAQKDAEAHAGQDGYKGRFRVSKLSEVYQVIVTNFDPKG